MKKIKCYHLTNTEYHQFKLNFSSLKRTSAMYNFEKKFLLRRAFYEPRFCVPYSRISAFHYWMFSPAAGFRPNVCILLSQLNVTLDSLQFSIIVGVVTKHFFFWSYSSEEMRTYWVNLGSWVDSNPIYAHCWLWLESWTVGKQKDVVDFRLRTETRFWKISG